MTETKLSPGDNAPDFTLSAVLPTHPTEEPASGAPGEQVSEVSLKDLRGERVVLYFYPAAMTPGCTTQACDFRDSLSALKAAGVSVMGVSKDEPARLRRFIERDSLNFPLLSDGSLEVHKAYGAYGEKTMYGKKTTGVLRSTFIISPGGVIEKAMYNVKATGHVTRIRKELGL